MKKVTLIPGDGIGFEISQSLEKVFKAAKVPIEFENQSDYDGIDEYDELQLTDVENSLAKGEFTVKNLTKNNEFKAKFNGSARELKILKYGGYLKFAVSDEFLN